MPTMTKILLVLLLLFPQLIRAETSEALIQKLETQLLENDSAKIRTEEEVLDLQILKSFTPEQRSQKNETEIRALSQGQKEIIAFKEKADAISAKLKKVQTSLAEINANLFSATQSDQWVEVSLDLSSLKEISVLSIFLKIDDEPLVDLTESGLMAGEDSVISLYRGPLSPGEHSLALTVRLSPTETKSLRLDQDAISLAGNQFSVNIPAEKTRKKIMLGLEKGSQNFEIKMLESDL